MPYTPRFTIAADISADTWLGASGWARGSHACSGTMPGLRPEPDQAQQEHHARDRGDRSAAAARSAEQPSPGVAQRTDQQPDQDRDESRGASSPRTSGRRPRTAGRAARCSATTSSSEVNAISSQHTRNVATLAATGTSSIAATNSGSTACAPRPSRPCCV